MSYKDTNAYKNLAKYYSSRGKFIRQHPQKSVYIPFAILETDAVLWDDIRAIYFNLKNKDEVLNKFKFEFVDVYPSVLNFFDFFTRKLRVTSDYQITKKFVPHLLSRFKQNKKFYDLANIFISLFFYYREHYPYFFLRDFCIFLDVNFRFKRLSFYDIIADKETTENIDRIFSKALSKGYVLISEEKLPSSREELLCFLYARTVDNIIKSDIFLNEFETFFVNNEFDIIEGFRWAIFNFREFIDFAIVAN